MPRSAAAESAAEHRGDDFERLYAQYRPRPSPAPSSYYSAHSSQSGGSSQDPWHTFNRYAVCKQKVHYYSILLIMHTENSKF